MTPLADKLAAMNVFTIRPIPVLLLLIALIAQRAPAEERIVVQTIAEGSQPRAAVAADGVVYVTYGTPGTIWCIVSSDAGKSFGKPVKVGEAKSIPLGMGRGPRVATTKDAVCITAVVSEVGGGKDGDVACWRSVDRGQTWTGPVKLNSTSGAAREGFNALAGSGDTLFCAWLDLRNGDGKTQIWGAASHDGGKTWDPDHLVYASPDGHVCECCHPSVSLNAKGDISVMFRNWLGGNRDLYVAQSKDGGKTFDSGAKAGKGSWQLNGCPMDGGAMVATDTATFCAWRRESHVYFSALDSKSDEIDLGEGLSPSIAMGSDLHLVWIVRRNGPLMHRTASIDRVETIADVASDPSLASPAGGGFPVVAVWQSGGKVNFSVLENRGLATGPATSVSRPSISR